jgi:hypothetical protein
MLALDEGNCGVSRRRVEEAGVKTASPRTETCSEAGDMDKLAPHNGVRDSVSQVKHGVIPGRFTSPLNFIVLPGFLFSTKLSFEIRSFLHGFPRSGDGNIDHLVFSAAEITAIIRIFTNWNFDHSCPSA